MSVFDLNLLILCGFLLTKPRKILFSLENSASIFFAGTLGIKMFNLFLNIRNLNTKFALKRSFQSFKSFQFFWFFLLLEFLLLFASFAPFCGKLKPWSWMKKRMNSLRMVSLCKPWRGFCSLCNQMGMGRQAIKRTFINEQGNSYSRLPSPCVVLSSFHLPFPSASIEWNSPQAEASPCWEQVCLTLQNAQTFWEGFASRVEAKEKKMNENHVHFCFTILDEIAKSKTKKVIQVMHCNPLIHREIVRIFFWWQKWWHFYCCCEQANQTTMIMEKDTKKIRTFRRTFARFIVTWQKNELNANEKRTIISEHACHQGTEKQAEKPSFPKDLSFAAFETESKFQSIFFFFSFPRNKLRWFQSWFQSVFLLRKANHFALALSIKFQDIGKNEMHFEWKLFQNSLKLFWKRELNTQEGSEQSACSHGKASNKLCLSYCSGLAS